MRILLVLLLAVAFGCDRASEKPAEIAAGRKVKIDGDKVTIQTEEGKARIDRKGEKTAIQTEDGHVPPLTQKAKRKPGMDPEVAAAIAEFKAKPGFRQEAAKKLVPLITLGMSAQEVREILGEPSSKAQDREGAVWHYGLFYSDLLTVCFGSNGKVRKVFPGSAK